MLDLDKTWHDRSQKILAFTLGVLFNHTFLFWLIMSSHCQDFSKE